MFFFKEMYFNKYGEYSKDKEDILLGDEQYPSLSRAGSYISPAERRNTGTSDKMKEHHYDDEKRNRKTGKFGRTSSEMEI